MSKQLFDFYVALSIERCLTQIEQLNFNQF